MERKALLEKLSKTNCILVVMGEGDDKIIRRNKRGLWVIKTLMGILLYDDFELCDSLRENSDILDILEQ